MVDYCYHCFQEAPREGPKARPLRRVTPLLRNPRGRHQGCQSKAGGGSRPGQARPGPRLTSGVHHPVPTLIFGSCLTKGCTQVRPSQRHPAPPLLCPLCRAATSFFCAMQFMIKELVALASSCVSPTSIASPPSPHKPSLRLAAFSGGQHLTLVLPQQRTLTLFFGRSSSFCCCSCSGRLAHVASGVLALLACLGSCLDLGDRCLSNPGAFGPKPSWLKRRRHPAAVVPPSLCAATMRLVFQLAEGLSQRRVAL